MADEECRAVLAQWHPIIATAAYKMHLKVKTFFTEEDLVVVAQYECLKAHEAGVNTPRKMAMTLNSRLIDYVRSNSPVRRGVYREARAAGEGAKLFARSLDEPIAANAWRERTFADVTEDTKTDSPEEAAMRAERIQAVQDALERLPERDAHVVRRRMEGWTFEAIGHELSVTESRVCQIWKRLERDLEWLLKSDPRVREA